MYKKSEVARVVGRNIKKGKLQDDSWEVHIVQSDGREREKGSKIARKHQKKPSPESQQKENIPI